MIRRCKSFIEVFILVVIVVLVSSSNSTNSFNVENSSYNRSIDLATMALKLQDDIKNDLYSAKDTYTGDLTGYTADCPLCSGKLACLPNYYVLDGTDTYEDINYGTVKIVASSKNLPCGSIIRFNKASVSDTEIIAIVLDRGVLGNDIDLLSSTEEYAVSYVGRSSITYDVLRKGWSLND